jgi:serine/threonine protein kinase
VTPFERGSEEETLKAIKENKFEFMEKIREIPPSAKDLISEMLQKDPMKRPTAAKALDHIFLKNYSK